MRFVFLAFLAVAGLSYAKPVKEIEGVKIPRGVSANYDELENITVIDYPIYNQFGGFSGTFTILSASVTYNNATKQMAPKVLFSLQTMEGNPLPMYKMKSFIDAKSVMIFVKNKDEVKRYTYTLKNKQLSKKSTGSSTEIVPGGSVSSQNVVVREYEYTDDAELIAFLTDSLNPKSEVSLRFVGNIGEQSITQELPKGDTAQIYNVLTLYKNLRP